MNKLVDVPRPGPGRPAVLPEAERRRRLFEAAADIFTASGYAASTMSDIAARAGMSKKTLYQMFASKLALFDALLADCIFTTELPEPPPGLSQEETLTRLLLSIADFFLVPNRTGLIRLIVADGQVFPELMTAFERLRMKPKINTLEQWLERECQAGRLRIANVADAAHFLFCISVAEPTLLALLRAPRLPDEPTTEQRIRTGVKIFLHGVSAVS
jgi:AcrR family transcriptional regulator